MMRVSQLTYDESRECMGCRFRDEKQVSTYILSFQIAERLLKRFQGQWEIQNQGIVLHLEGLAQPVSIGFHTDMIRYGTVTTFFTNRYAPEKGVVALVDEISEDLNIPVTVGFQTTDFLFRVITKLVEIFHARCNLQIAPSKTADEWEIRLDEQGPSGWISKDLMAENRFGEKMDIAIWDNLRPEKAATYVFGFNRFCKNFQCPMK